MAKRRPKHLVALELTYEQYVTLNGGEHCGICGRPPKEGGRKLHRDHDHRSEGKPRGLLCWPCNRALPYYADAEWLEKAAAYLRRAAALPDPDVSVGGVVGEAA